MTLFEKIIAREIPADIVFEDQHCLAFRDISPKAPVHILVVPKRVIARVAESGVSDSALHILVVPKRVIARVAESGVSDSALLGHLLVTAAQIARAEGIAESGFRLVINNGPDGGESVPHLHVHLLGGRPMAWPPG